MSRKQLQDAILKILQNSPLPLKAREIRTSICRELDLPSITVKDINSILYSELRHTAVKDEEHRWKIQAQRSSAKSTFKNKGLEQALQHIDEAKKLSELLGGTDADVKQYLFSLSESDLSVILNEYENQYGASKREYAENILPLWRTGRRKMSGLVAERLYNLLPPRMPLQIKYDMVQTLWKKFSPSSKASYVIGPDCDPTLACNIIEQHLLESISKYTIPHELENRFSWLSAGDVSIRQDLLNYFLEKERALIIEDASNRTKIIMKHLQQHGQWTECIKQEYTLCNQRLEIFFDKSATGIMEGRPCPSNSQQLVDKQHQKIPESSGCLMLLCVILVVGATACVCIVVNWF
ncbi:MAG: hypothetical protein JNJ77_10900 [Planctomycetia bacterium]|nr:hypothetical protein [Planctomycetia bacterium]